MKKAESGTTEATIRPMTIALIVDAECSIGLRLLYGIRENDKVSITARKKMVVFDLTSALRTSPGKIPVKFVIKDRTTARLIMNALLQSRLFGLIRVKHDVGT
jgi:hypothetical protein